jgi:hypothetical protein
MQEPRGEKGSGTAAYSGQDLREMFTAATSWLERAFRTSML